MQVIYDHLKKRKSLEIELEDKIDNKKKVEWTLKKMTLNMPLIKKKNKILRKCPPSLNLFKSLLFQREEKLLLQNLQKRIKSCEQNLLTLLSIEFIDLNCVKIFL